MMIYRVEIENFYSVRERQVIDLAARGCSPSDPKKVVKMSENPDTWVPRVVAVFGPNASGKSNVLRAISFVTFFMTTSAFGSSNSIIPYFKFNAKEMEKSSTFLSISFLSNRNFLSKKDQFAFEKNLVCKYIYEVEFSKMDKGNGEKVINESLYYFCEDKKDRICIFERDKDGKVKISDKIGSYSKIDTIKDNLKPNASVISTLLKEKDQFATEFSKMINSTSTNILIDREDSPHNYIKRYVDDSELLKSLNFELGRLDIGVSSVDVSKKSGNPQLYFNHDGLSKKVIMDLESHGTKRFIATYPILNDALKSGGVAVVDELDISLHPMVLPEIVSWFEDSEKNPRGAQLWMTCHSILLMRNLVKEGVVICGKNRKGSSSVYSLGSVEGVRDNEDFVEGYILGVFGGIPVIG